MSGLEVQILGDASRPTLIYFPGLHGDWTLCGPFQRKIAQQVRLVRFAYPTTTNWTLTEQADAIAQVLRERNITEGWLLGESFGSQILWAFLNTPGQTFQAKGIIVAGGFVRYPIMPLVHIARFLCRIIPRWLWHLFLKGYIPYAKRFRQMTDEDAAEMLRRQHNIGREPYLHRLRLIAENNPAEIAKNVACPVYHLSGSIDPIVPWYLVRPWLRKNCPRYVESKIITADHNVLGSSVAASEKEILRWMGQPNSK